MATCGGVDSPFGPIHCEGCEAPAETPERVERVARAIYDAGAFEPTDTHYNDHNVKPAWITMARAAIRAMGGG